MEADEENNENNGVVTEEEDKTTAVENHDDDDEDDEVADSVDGSIRTARSQTSSVKEAGDVEKTDDDEDVNSCDDGEATMPKSISPKKIKRRSKGSDLPQHLRYQFTKSSRFFQRHRLVMVKPIKILKKHEANLMKKGRDFQIEEMLANGLDIDARYQGGSNESGLMLALSTNNQSVIDVLINNDANVRSKDDNGKTVLMYAVAGTDTGTVKRILSRGAKSLLNKKDKEGKTALMYAAMNDKTDNAELLLRKGARVEDFDNSGMTALTHAVSKGHFELVKYLVLFRSANVNGAYSTVSGPTPMMMAANTTNLKMVEFFLENPNVKLHDTDINGMTVGMYACIGGNVKILEKLEIRGCQFDQDITDSTGMNCLMHASRNGSMDAIRWLVEHCNFKDDNVDSLSMTALMHACTGGHVEAVKYLIEHASSNLSLKDTIGMTGFLAAASEGHVPVMDTLFEMDNTVLQSSDHSGRNAAIHAAMAGHLPVLQWLTSHGVDFNKQIDVNATIPLMYAARHGQIDIVRYLLASCTNVNVKDINGLTALMHCCSNPETAIEIADILLNNGADVSLVDNLGMTVLMHAVARKCDTKFVKILIAKGCRIQHSDLTKKTVIMLAAENGDANCIKAILDASSNKTVDTSAMDRHRRNALIFAAKLGHVEAVETLIDYGLSEKNSIDCDGYTALMHAAAQGHKDIVKALLHRAVDIKQRDAGGKTATKIARDRGNLNIYWLIKRQSMLSS